jgi:hypothetical protein
MVQATTRASLAEAIDVTMLPNNRVVTMIGQVQKLGVKLDTLIHNTAVQCMLHARRQPEGHGDVTLMQRLVESLGKSTRRKGLLVWMEMFSPIRVNGDGKWGLQDPTRAKNYVEFNVGVAAANPFWTLEEADEKVAKPLSIEAFVGIIKGYAAKVAKAEEGNENYEIKGNVVSLKEYLNRLSQVAIPTAANDNSDGDTPVAQAQVVNG